MLCPKSYGSLDTFQFLRITKASAGKASAILFYENKQATQLTTDIFILGTDVESELGILVVHLHELLGSSGRNLIKSNQFQGSVCLVRTKWEAFCFCGTQALSAHSVIQTFSAHLQILLDLLQMYEACWK